MKDRILNRIALKKYKTPYNRLPEGHKMGVMEAALDDIISVASELNGEVAKLDSVDINIARPMLHMYHILHKEPEYTEAG